MSICGYHPKMGDALRVFSDGLVSAVMNKAGTRKTSLGTQLAAEVDEIAALEAFLSRCIANSSTAEERRSAEMLLAVVYLAKAQFGDLDFLIKNPDEFQNQVTKNTLLMDRILREFEDQFEARLNIPLSDRPRQAWHETIKALEPETAPDSV
ncbi:MAG: hypothetical protein HW380_2970 [Magnetococcales bacterium]|nr:hypothetical protein [Magnetococcales bacterium]HIJ84807.1 hypothetical protein [Magnetococcales bacterium]